MKKLKLKKVKVFQLNDNEQNQIQGGRATVIGGGGGDTTGAGTVRGCGVETGCSICVTCPSKNE